LTPLALDICGDIIPPPVRLPIGKDGLLDMVGREVGGDMSGEIRFCC
jgi:hypothetical protein